MRRAEYLRKDLVTGNMIARHNRMWCAIERDHVSWIERALGNTDCGVEAIHFRPTTDLHSVEPKQQYGSKKKNRRGVH